MKNLLRSKRVRQGILVLIDLAIVAVCTWLSLAMRFSLNSIPPEYIALAFKSLPIDMVITVAVFWIFKLYHSVWSFASINEVIRIFEAVTVVILLEITYKTLALMTMPRSIYFMTYASMIVLVTMSRLSIRVIKHYYYGRREKTDSTRIMMIGAGSAGVVLLNEFSSDYNNNNKVVCIIDDNENKKDKYLHGIHIIGGRDKIINAAKTRNIDEIIIAIPSASPDEISDIVSICNKTDCRVKILPSITKTLRGNIAANLRDISYEDFLSRDPVKVNDEGIDEYISDRVILVTGGGGSIGSELCRQIAKRNPKQLIILDIYENNAYSIQMELNRHYPKLDVRTIISSVRDEARMECVFKKYRPEIVFHAAAHKHVPLMEYSPNEAIRNNCRGTLNTAKLADKYGVDKFVLISTDKAVRPTSIMGASKRICEMIIQDLARKSDTTFAAVRFGNVLGSNGSVIPLFLRQIEEGGPVTVTHRDITRFFMTIPEAVSLVMQAGAFAKGGEIFVLDMGKQVKIYDLAESLIKMKGYRPNEDIKIEITGLRPGEKLYEEVLMDEEGMEKTGNDMIFIGLPIDMNYMLFEHELKRLFDAAEANADNIKERTQKICDTYTITNN